MVGTYLSSKEINSFLVLQNRFRCILLGTYLISSTVLNQCVKYNIIYAYKNPKDTGNKFYEKNSDENVTKKYT